MSRGLIAGLRHCLDFLGTASGVVKLHGCGFAQCDVEKGPQGSA